MLNIEPIKLLKGSHDDTGQTGSGCFMNVIAYLNGEPQITDQSPCVCPTVRPIAIWLNDYMKDDERHALLPFVQRAMGTATDDKEVMNRRLELVVGFANDMAILAKGFADSSYAADAAYAADSAYAAYAAAADAAYAAAADAENRNAIIKRALEFMDAICPPADAPSQVLIERANRLIELAKA